VNVYKNGNIVRTITKHDYFGERSILFSTVRSATVIAETSVGCWVIEAENFLNIVNDRIKSQLLKRIEL